MSDYIEVELKYGLNWVVYKNTNRGVEDKTQLLLKNDDDNEYTPIGTLAEVRDKTPPGSSTEVMNKDGNLIAEMHRSTGALLRTTLYAKNPNTPTNKGGKRKTKKYFRKRKTDKRKSKRKKKGKGKGKTRKFR